MGIVLVIMGATLGILSVRGWRKPPVENNPFHRLMRWFEEGSRLFTAVGMSLIGLYVVLGSPLPNFARALFVGFYALLALGGVTLASLSPWGVMHLFGPSHPHRLLITTIVAAEGLAIMLASFGILGVGVMVDIIALGTPAATSSALAVVGLLGGLTFLLFGLIAAFRAG